MSDVHVLYRHYDKGGNLLYVGVTNNFARRIKEHSKFSSWFSDVSNVTLEHFDDRETLLQAEKTAIQSERPIFNIRLNRGESAKLDEEEQTVLVREKDNLFARVLTLKPIYKQQEAAGILGVSRHTIRWAIQSGHLNYFDLPNGAGTKTNRYVSGWQILDWLDRIGGI